MTTAAGVAGRPFSGWSRDARWGTWYALCPEHGDAPSPGALRIDRALLAPQGARERLATAVLAVARLRLPGVPATVDLVAEAGDVWLITARPPLPTLEDVAASDGPRPDAGSVASVLNETAQTLLALHAAGLAHGSLTASSVVLAPDGTALLAESALGTALGDHTPAASARRADITAWAALARTLATTWAASGTPAADLFARCAATAESEGLAAARAVLVAGRTVLPADFLQRTALRAATAAAIADFTLAATEDGPAAAREATVARKPATPGAGTEVRVVARESDVVRAAVRERDAQAAAGERDVQAAVQGEVSADPRIDATAMPPGRLDHVSRPAAPDDQATVLGRRNRIPGPGPESAPLTDSVAAGDGDILLRFGPGIPVAEQESLRALWERTAAAAPTRRRRSRAWMGATVVLTALAVVVWLLLLRPSAGPTVTAAEVRAPAGQLHCGQTADVIGVLTTDGHGGPVTYRWLRSDGHDSGELVHEAGRGDSRITVHLQWTVRGPGRFRGTARLQVLHQDRTSAPIEAEGTVSYSCP
ncbi:hypothetical protein GCM10022403_098470 [Streptomyces coacervatus]|uniref:Ig-like domain-containing protein n=1 Tax=Streptomyces coacervatus TaxID=647381 RepID=A0ABP7JQC7_9ACTN|nr:hypothetical protein [Streptomyces coacervatus]MDF2263913.1 hypothetical protein [Streptomyces coacervatus]